MSEKIKIPTNSDKERVKLEFDTVDWKDDGLIAMDRCEYCGVWSEEFDICPHCGAAAR